MASQKGRDFLLKIGDGEESESFTALGAARVVQMVVNNNPLDATSMGDQGVQNLIADAGVQTMQLSVDGLFKDSDAEEALRTVAMGRSGHNFQLAFPNGDVLEASFVVKDYTRGGTYDGLESFSATLLRNGAESFTTS